jgi:hypothetical protein
MLRVAPRLAAALAAVAACTAPVDTGSLVGSEAPGDDSVALPTRTPADRPGADAGPSRPPTTTSAPLDAGEPSFLDTFTRPDGPSLGNGWVEKMPGVFAIKNAAAFQTRDAPPYGDSFVSRPMSEAMLDVEVSADFLFPATLAPDAALDDGGDPNGPPDPALYARIQSESSAPGTFTCYSFFVLPDLVGITRELHQAGGQFLTSGPIAPAIAANTLVHVVFRVKGSNPVTLEGTISTPNGTVLKAVATTDTDPSQIVAAGPVGFGADKGGLAFDNFAAKSD